MRRDMPQLLVERERGGERRRFGARMQAFQRKTRTRKDLECLPQLMPMGFRQTKWLNENLGPLRGFLKSKLGCPWNDVYSELRQRLCPKNTVHMHIMQHLWQYVWFTRRDADQVLWLVSPDGAVERPARAGSVTPFQRPMFYVCCDTGRLRLN